MSANPSTPKRFPDWFESSENSDAGLMPKLKEGARKAGHLAAVGGMIVALATESMVGMAVGGAGGGAAGFVVGKELADDFFGPLNRSR